MNLQGDVRLKENEQQKFNPEWGHSAPKGGRAVLNRVLRDGAKVPLFLGQTLARSLRDLGYSSTTSAVCEHVDNAIQWGASEVRVYFHQSGTRGKYKIDVLVLDDGKGMAPHVLKVATAFGGSMVYENRSGIGRYGMGMKAAALSMSPVLDIYSWQQPGAIYNMMLDVEEIGADRSNLIELPDPQLSDELPSQVSDILIRPMTDPKNRESQTLLAENHEMLKVQLGRTGTIIFMPDCDRLSYRRAKTLVDHAVKNMGRIYRRYIEKGLKLYVNNASVNAFDPTYWMVSARHTKTPNLPAKQSRLVKAWKVDLPITEGSPRTAPVNVRLYALPYNEWSGLPRKILKNDIHVFDGSTVSFLRNDREVDVGSSYRKLGITAHPDNNWLRLQIDFGGNLDEAFGVSANKQGVRPQDHVFKIIGTTIREELSALRGRIKQQKAESAAGKGESKMREAERRATDSDSLQGKPLPVPNPETPDETAALEENLRALAIGLKRDNETDDAAFARVRSSQYLIVFKHDEYWPFYHCDFKFGKVILTINTAHAFFHKLWNPLSRIAGAVEKTDVGGDADTDEVTIDPEVAALSSKTLVALQLLLLSLARTQSQLCGPVDENDHSQLLETFRREWSENLATQLSG